MATTTIPPAITKNVSLTIDGREVTVPEGDNDHRRREGARDRDPGAVP